MPAGMDLITTNSVAVFSLGTLFGASSVYWFLRFMKFPAKPQKVPVEERFEFDDPKDEYRLIMAVRNDLKMQKGKVAAQCGHAAVAAYAKASKERPKLIQLWLKYGGTKIAVRIDSEEELIELAKSAKKQGILASIVRDAGQTQVAPGTRTVLAIGPAPKSALDRITGHLKLF